MVKLSEISEKNHNSGQIWLMLLARDHITYPASGRQLLLASDKKFLHNSLDSHVFHYAEHKQFCIGQLLHHTQTHRHTETRRQKFEFQAIPSQYVISGTWQNVTSCNMLTDGTSKNQPREDNMHTYSPDSY